MLQQLRLPYSVDLIYVRSSLVGLCCSYVRTRLSGVAFFLFFSSPTAVLSPFAIAHVPVEFTSGFQFWVPCQAWCLARAAVCGTASFRHPNFLVPRGSFPSCAVKLAKTELKSACSSQRTRQSSYFPSFAFDTCLPCARLSPPFGCLLRCAQAVDYDGNTPLIWATRGGHRDCVGHLLDSGASTKTPDENGNTALHFSCQVCAYAVSAISRSRRIGRDVFPPTLRGHA